VLINIQDQSLQFAQMQNCRLWMLSHRSRQLFKVRYNEELNKEHQMMALAKSYQATLGKKRVEKMQIDRSGNHCFLICTDSLYYAHFNGNNLQQILVEELDQEAKPALHFTCVDIQFIV
jgi:hypothetical protein